MPSECLLTTYSNTPLIFLLAVPRQTHLLLMREHMIKVGYFFEQIGEISGKLNHAKAKTAEKVKVDSANSIG